jgi:hypothetical protein
LRNEKIDHQPTTIFRTFVRRKNIEMETITLRINEKSNFGKAIMEMIKVGVKEKKGIEIVEEKSPYNPEFVAMVKKSAASKKRYRVDNVDKLWESL